MAVRLGETIGIFTICICAIGAVAYGVGRMPNLPPAPNRTGAIPTLSIAANSEASPAPAAPAAPTTPQPFVATPTNKYEWSPDRIPVDWPKFSKLPNEQPLPPKTTAAKLEMASGLITQWNQYKAGNAKTYPSSKDTGTGIKYLLTIPRSDPAFSQAWAIFINLKQVDEAISDERATASAREEQRRQAKQQGVSVGMTAQQVIESSWGKPQKINVTITGRGKHEQWVYNSSSYLYFEDGVLTSIQTSH